MFIKPHLKSNINFAHFLLLECLLFKVQFLQHRKVNCKRLLPATFVAVASVMVVCVNRSRPSAFVNDSGQKGLSEGLCAVGVLKHLTTTYLINDQLGSHCT